MASKVILTVCGIALLVQMAMAQANCGCGGNAGLVGLAGNGLAGYGSSAYTGSGSTYVGNGGGFGVTTYSPIAPAGISVRSDNGIEGTLCIDGGLPVYSAIAFEGQLPTSGSAGVQYSCGSNVGISNSAGQGRAGLGNGAGVAGAGLGYGASGLVGAGQAGGLNGCGCGY